MKILSRQLNGDFQEVKRKNEGTNKNTTAKLSILDETDSGLDIDALRIVQMVLTHIKTKKCFSNLTHYQDF